MNQSENLQLCDNDEVKMKNYIQVILLILISLSFTNAQSFRSVGSAGANFLQVPVEPVGAALGNSSVAHADGIEGLYWNPATIAYSDNAEILFSTVDWIADTRLSFVGATNSFGFGTLGISVTAFTMDDMEITTELQPNGTGRYFDAGSYSVGLTYATRVIDRFSFGATVKYIYEYIWDMNSSAVAFDLGSVYYTGFYNLRIGMRLANFGGEMKFSGDQIDNKDQVIMDSGIELTNDPRLERVSESSSLPQVFNVGIAIDPMNNETHRITIMSSVNEPNDNKTQLSFGTEYAFKETILLRGGIKSGYEEQNFSFGVGINYELAGFKTQFNYGYSAFGILGDINYLSLRIGY